MIESWWDAHALEVVVWGLVVGFLWFVSLLVSLGEAWRERKQKKRDGLL